MSGLVPNVKIGQLRFDRIALGMAYLELGDKGSALEEYKILKDLDKDLANKLFNHIYE